MSKTAMWFQFHPDNGGLVRVNVHETIGTGKAKRTLPGEDLNIKLAEFSDDEREALLGAFEVVADHVGAKAKDVEE